MPRFTKVIIIFNPNSTGDSKGMAKELKSILRKEIPTLKVKLTPTEYAGHAEVLARQAAHRLKRPLIISSSGDGGYNEVINGVVQANNPNAVTAVLPAGNANDHSRTMHSQPLWKSIKRDKISRIDVLKIEITRADKSVLTRYAHSYIGLGLTPVIAAELNRHTLNALREIKIVLQRFYKYRPFKIRRSSKTIQFNSLLFANINQMAKVLTLAPKNKPDDGKFEVITFSAGKKWHLVKKLFKATVSNLEASRSVPSYNFGVVKKMPIQLDGEVMALYPGDRVKVVAVHKGLKTII